MLYRTDIPTLQLVLEEFGPNFTDWYPLGVFLGLKTQDLDAVRVNDREVCMQFISMINCWLRTKPEASWADLCGALRKLGKNKLAEDLSCKFCKVVLQPLTKQLATAEGIVSAESAGVEAHNITSPIDTEPVSDDEEWDPPAEFADMLPKVIKLLNESADVDNLKQFLKFLSHPRTHQRYIDSKIYEQCNTPGEIVEALYPQYINFMHTHLLRRIVNKFGDDQAKSLVKHYEENFPCKKPLKRMREPLSDEDIPGTKRINVMYNGDANIANTTKLDVETVQQTIERNTGIDRIVIVYAKQTPGSVIFTFLIPETVLNVFSDLDGDNRRDLADHGILRIDVNSYIIDLQPSNLSTYTTSGCKRVPITQDSAEFAHWNSEFQHLTSQIQNSLAESVENSILKKFLLNFNHILYPESQYIDSSLLKDAKSVSEVFTALNPQVMNFLNWGILQKVVGAFDSKLMPTLQSYTAKFSPHTQLSTLPDALSEKQILEFSGVQRLRVTLTGGGNEWTLGDVQQVREVVEKVAGVDQDFITYAYWEGGFTTHQFTFLFPVSVSEIFSELCEEDLTILANAGVRSLELDYDIVADNIQELYNQLAQPVVPVSEEDRVRTKNFGLEHFIPESNMEQISKEEFSYLNDLITNTVEGKLQETCSDESLKEFAKKMQSWKDLAPYLGISEWDLEELEEIYPGDEHEQKYLALRRWKVFDEKTATYERLVECLLTHGHIDDAKELLLNIQSLSGR